MNISTHFHMLTSWPHYAPHLTHSTLTFFSHQVALTSWGRTSHPQCQTQAWAPAPPRPASAWEAAVGTSCRWPKSQRTWTQLLKWTGRQTNSSSFWRPGNEGSRARLRVFWETTFTLKAHRWKRKPRILEKSYFLLWVLLLESVCQADTGRT